MNGYTASTHTGHMEFALTGSREGTRALLAAVQLFDTYHLYPEVDENHDDASLLTRYDPRTLRTAVVICIF